MKRKWQQQGGEGEGTPRGEGGEGRYSQQRFTQSIVSGRTGDLED